MNETLDLDAPCLAPGCVLLVYQRAYDDECKELIEGGAYWGVAPLSARSAVWEPVIRHVAEALSALEQTGAVGADLILCIRVRGGLTGGWLRNLRWLVGDESPGFPISSVSW